MAYFIPTKRRSKGLHLLNNVNFDDMLLRDSVLDGLTQAGYKVPSAIQYEAIPVARGGNDLLVQAKSGTGKTLVFVITALEILSCDLFEPQVLILVPERVIATQICSVIKSVSSSFPDITYACFIGGFDVYADIIKAANCQIVIGTPGRIKHLMCLKALSTTSIRLLVLDKVDHLVFGKGLEEDVECIFNSLPEKRQVIATSATYPEERKTKILRYLTHPFMVCSDSRHLGLLGITHYAKKVEHSPMAIKQYRIKLAALESILTTIKFLQCVVYCNGINKVETLSRDIKKWGFSTAYISSKKQQEGCLEALDCLKRFKCKVLISSDVFARGTDAENVNLVINFDIPQYPQTYVNRSGHAGRYGTESITITLVNESELENLEIIEHAIGFKSYELPDPVPVYLIDDPCLEKYAVTVSEGDELEEESEKSGVVTAKDFTELKENSIKNGDHAVQNDNVKKERTSSKCLSATKILPEHSKSKSERKNLNMTHSSSATDVKSFHGKVPCDKGQESLFDSSSAHNFLHNRGKKGKRLEKRMYSAAERSNYLESKQQECHSSYERAYQHLHYPDQKVHYSSHVKAHPQLYHSSHVNVHQQPHCSHSNAYQQLHHSACSIVCPQPHSDSQRKSRFSGRHRQSQHSSIGSIRPLVPLVHPPIPFDHCKSHVSVKKHDSVNRKTENLPCCVQHCAICFMPSVPRCHPSNDNLRN